MGHQILSLAAGAEVIKLPYGHRSHNQPVHTPGSKKGYITSQNHSYVVTSESLKEDWEVWFKNVNDGHGHLVGTQILGEIGALLKEVLRKNDLIYRYGGDEFVLIIPYADKQTAQKIGERILTKVKKKQFAYSDSRKGFNLTVSIGIALFPENGKSRQDILTLADKMMYAAKSSGRGTVRMALEYFEQ